MQSAVEKEALINFLPGTMSPMNATIDYSRIATAIAMNTSSPPAMRVSECGMFNEYGELMWSVFHWRQGLRWLADRIHEKMGELTFHQDFGLNIPNNTGDDWANEDRGYSWTERHAFLPDKRLLLAAMLANPELKLAKIDDAGQLIFDHAAIWTFLHRCDALNEMIALLAFFTAGQTPRVSEFIDHKHANSTRPRTLFRDGKSLWLATRRVKSESLAGKETFLPMKCHPELTGILERYLLIIRPVEAEMVKIVRGEKQYHVYKEYLWTKGGERTTPDQMRASILKFNTDYCGVAAGTRDYRQICVQMRRTFLGSEFEIKQEEMDALSYQAGHSPTMARLKYAPEVGQVACMSSDLLLRFGRMSEAWWEHAGFKPGRPPLLSLRARQEHREAALEAAELHPAPAVDIQAIVLAVIAAVIAEFQKLQGSLDAQIKQSISQALPTAHHHHPNVGPPPPPHFAPPPRLSFSPPLPPTLIIEDVQMIHSDGEEEKEAPSLAVPIDMTNSIYSDDEAVEDSAGPEADQPPLHLHRDLLTHPTRDEAVSDSDEDLNALLALHFPLVSSPSFASPEQKKAVRLAVEQRHSFVAILPAGDIGLIYTLPALNSKEEAARRHPSYIIVSSPSLLKDHVDHARQIGIGRYKQWSDKNKKVDLDKHRLVFLTIATAGSTKFKEYVHLYLTPNHCLIHLGRLGIGMHMGSMPLVGFWSVQTPSYRMHRFMAFTIMPQCSTLNGFSSWKLFHGDFRPAFSNRLVFLPIPTSSVHLATSHISATSSSRTTL
jgi:hypothetical protein